MLVIAYVLVLMSPVKTRLNFRAALMLFFLVYACVASVNQLKCTNVNYMQYTG